MHRRPWPQRRAEIAAAALAYERAKDDSALVRHAFSGPITDVGYGHIERHNADEMRCRDAYLAVLAKVRV